MKYTFKELIDVPVLQALTDELYAVASIPSAIITMDGEILTGSGWQKICTDFHRKHPQIEKECIESDTTIRRELDGGEPFVIYKCPRGLVDASSPIIIAGEHVANVFSGQVFLESRDETTERFFREQARKFGFDEGEYIKAFKKVPIFKEKNFRAGIYFLVKLAQTIADNGLTRLRELEAVESVRENEGKYRVLYEKSRKAEEVYRSLLHTSADAILMYDLDGKVSYLSPAFTTLFGWTLEELKGNRLQFLPKSEKKESMAGIMGIIEDGKAIQGFETKRYSKNGRLINVSMSGSRFNDAKGNPAGILVLIRDISERTKLEAQLQQAQKMEAIATLAGGVAHEFNNALMGIMGNIEMLKWDFPEDERRDKSFEAMNESGHRMSRLTDQLLAYSEGGKYNAKNLKLDDFVIETLPILQHDLNPEARVETRFQKDISYIRADHAQMQMVLSAILANSNEAIEDEGIIRIGAENKDIDEAFTKQHPGLKPGLYVCLTIEDNGKGMDEETIDGIFEPFFTTKFQGRGMGMAAVYGIIKGHDGAITVESEPGKGSVVRIYLPAVEAKEDAKAVKQPKTEIPMGEGTILVIEDEEPLVGLFRKILERLGYRVLLARTGKEAVELAKTFDGQIDLALLDIKLPDMDGGSLYPLIMAVRPDLKTIVCSGYSIDGPAQAILDAGAEGFIQKPFSIAPFAEKLKEVLEGK